MPMRNIYNVADLNKELRGLAEDIVPSVADTMAETGKTYVRRIVYDGYKVPAWGGIYRRTFQLTKNFVNLGKASNERNNIYYAVGYDLSKLNYESVVPGYTANGALIPALVEKGDAGGIFNKGKWRDQVYNYPRVHTFAQPRPFFQLFRKDVKDKLFIEQFEKELASKKVVYEKGE